MAIVPTYINPYSNGDIVSFDDGSQVLKRRKVEYIPSAGKDIVHITMENDTLWTIANFRYGDDKWWYVIYDVNNLYNPFDLQIGLNLIIPDIDVIKATN